MAGHPPHQYESGWLGERLAKAEKGGSQKKDGNLETVQKQGELKANGSLDEILYYLVTKQKEAGKTCLS